MSRNPHERTAESRKVVRSLAAMGLRQDEICDLLEISEKTLRLYYRAELDEGLADANAAVVEALMKLIRRGRLGAIIFYEKCDGGPREKPTPPPEKKWWDRDWTKFQADLRYIVGGCPEEGRCKVAVCETILFKLGVGYLPHANSETIIDALIQVEAHMAQAEKDVVDYVACFEL